jgi:hypothetical protein
MIHFLLDGQLVLLPFPSLQIRLAVRKVTVVLMTSNASTTFSRAEPAI